MFPNQEVDKMQSSLIDCICFVIVIPIKAKPATKQRFLKQGKS